MPVIHLLSSISASTASLEAQLYLGRICVPCGCRCARKWRNKFTASAAVTSQQVAKYDSGWCPRCLGVCACKRCLVKPAQVVGGAAPVFSKAQEQAFALHTLAVLRPHIADFIAARDAEVCSLSSANFQLTWLSSYQGSAGAGLS